MTAPLNAFKQGSPAPKPQGRIVASPAEWDRLRGLFTHACCVSCGLPCESLHHVVPRSQGGDDIEMNLAPMCGDGTRGCHGRLESHAPGWERIAGHVRAYVMARASRHVYVLDKIGQDRFDRRYPQPPLLAIGDLARYDRPDPFLRETSEGDDQL